MSNGKYVSTDFRDFLESLVMEGDQAAMLLKNCKDGFIAPVEEGAEAQGVKIQIAWNNMNRQFNKKCRCSCTRGSSGARELSFAFHGASNGLSP